MHSHLTALQFGAMTYFFAGYLEVLHMWAEQLYLLHCWFLTADLRHQALTAFGAIFIGKSQHMKGTGIFHEVLKTSRCCPHYFCNIWEKYTCEEKMQKKKKKSKQENKIKRPAKLRPSCNSCVPENKMDYLDNWRKPARSNFQKSVLFGDFFKAIASHY